MADNLDDREMAEAPHETPVELWSGLWREAKVDTETLHGFAADFYSTLLAWTEERSGSACRVLEPGCGTGRFSRLLAQEHPNWTVTALDLSPEARRFFGAGAGRLPNVDFVEGDLFALPFEDDTFDIVFNEGVVEHFPNYQLAINEMARVLAPGGLMVVAVPNLRNVWHTRHKAAVGDAYEYGYEKSFTYKELDESMAEVCLSVLAHAGFDPAYGLERLEDRGHPGAALRASRVRRLVRLGDRIFGGSASRNFGFEIAVLATSSPSARASE